MTYCLLQTSFKKIIKNSKCQILLKTDSQAVTADKCVAIFDTLLLSWQKKKKKFFFHNQIIKDSCSVTSWQNISTHQITISFGLKSIQKHVIPLSTRDFDVFIFNSSFYVSITCNSALSWIADESDQNKRVRSLLCTVFCHLCVQMWPLQLCSLSYFTGGNTGEPSARGQQTKHSRHTLIVRRRFSSHRDVSGHWEKADNNKWSYWQEKAGKQRAGVG